MGRKHQREMRKNGRSMSFSDMKRKDRRKTQQSPRPIPFTSIGKNNSRKLQPTAQTISFLELPNELRLKIYACFTLSSDPTPILTECGPLTRWRSGKDHDGVEVTRRSLFLVSKEISEAWRPIFFKDAVIMADPPGSALREREHSKRAWKNTTLQFDRVFLRVSSEYTLSCVRYLRFNASIGHRDRQDPTENVNIEAVEQFIAVLQRHKHRLPALERVQVFGTIHQTVGQNLWCVGHSQWTLLHRFDDIDGLLGLQRRILNGAKDTVFHGWRPFRSVEVVQSKREECLSTIGITVTKGRLRLDRTPW